MPEMPQAAPLPDRPPLHLTGGYLAVASPDTIPEAAFSIPAIRAIHSARPNGTLIVVANAETSPLWRKVAEVTRVIEHPASDSPRKIARLLKDSEIPFDSAIAWEDSSAARAFKRIDIKQRLGYPSRKLAKYLTDPVKVVRESGPIEHRVKHYLLFVQKLGADPFEPSNFATPARPAAPADPIIAIAPGSDFGPAAEWSLDRFCELTSSLSAENDLVILPSPGHPGPAQALAGSTGQALSDLTGEALLEFLATCSSLIASDGSLPHLASFVGTPSIVLFGPNEPEWRRPLGRIHKIIREHVPCSGCLLNKCPLDHRCMEEIKVETVLRALEDLHRP